MFNRRHPLSMWQLVALAATLLLFTADLRSTLAQDLPGEGRISRSKRAPNPAINRVPSPFDRAIDQGNRARDINAYGEALAHYRQAQKLNPQDVRAYYGLGNVYSDLYCNDSAIKAYLTALDLKKNYLEARVGLGYAYAEEERYDDAQEQFQRALEIVPGDVEASTGLGLVYAKKEKYQEAIATVSPLTNSRSTEDKALAYLGLGDIYREELQNEQAITQYRKALLLKPDFAKAYCGLGLAQLNTAFSLLDYSRMNETKSQEKLSEAAKQASDSLKRAIELNYNNPDIYIGLGIALAVQFRDQEAVNQVNLYFDKVKGIESQLSSLSLGCGSGFSYLKAAGYITLGFVSLLKGASETDKEKRTQHFNDAVKQLNQAANLKQEMGGIYMLIGFTYLLQEKNDDAIEQFNKMIRHVRKETDKAVGYTFLGNAYSRMGRDDVAIMHLQDAIKRDAKKPAPYKLLAEIYARQGRIDESIVLLKKVIDLLPQPTPLSYFDLASALTLRYQRTRNEEDFNEAIRLLKKAIDIKVDYFEAYFALGAAYLTHFNADDAIANLNKAIAYNPKEPQVYLMLSLVYSDLKGNNDAAIGLLKETIKLKPDFAEAHWRLGVAHFRKDNHSEAIKELQEAIRIAPLLVQAYYDLSYIYVAEKNYSEAIRYLKKATENATLDPTPYIRLAEIYEYQQTNEDAARCYEEATKRLNANDLPNRILFLGRAARLRGKYAEAIGYFQQLIPVEPRDKAYYEMGITYVASKSKSAALEQYQQLVQLKSPLAEELLKKIQEIK